MLQIGLSNLIQPEKTEMTPLNPQKKHSNIK